MYCVSLLTPAVKISAGIHWIKVDSNIRLQKYSNIRIFTSKLGDIMTSDALLLHIAIALSNSP